MRTDKLSDSEATRAFALINYSSTLAYYVRIFSLIPNPGGPMLAAVKEWAKNQTYIVAILSPQIITTVRDFHIDFQHIKSRRFGNHLFAPQHFRTWFTLYRSHRKGNKLPRRKQWGSLFVSDIFNLVAAIDQDCDTNLLEALPKEPDALASALQPDRNLWRQLLNPDKKK
ncbi:hypothetical protein [Oryzomonas rubra]|uniref:Uncharacterized protein n=1 Tax=Oryzomonas rubra TaxID=2509454 RepID=A0A5A9X6Y0_9BACT|nr:hypothetical protein [Oryzomonas rubra]KAA0888383.1 hypothetical protein ET418_16780 [Oryzomonas rubra]